MEFYALLDQVVDLLRLLSDIAARHEPPQTRPAETDSR
jgi:hypothetical protein